MYTEHAKKVDSPERILLIFQRP